ncbi:MAG: PEP-CTERM sorting domain-containing protein [Planctomycetota bacterium]
MKAFAVLVAAGVAGSAAAEPQLFTEEINPYGLSASLASLEGLEDLVSPATTDGYRLAPGIGNAGGFAIAGSGVSDSTFDDAAEVIGSALSGEILGGADNTLSGDISAANTNTVFQISVFDNGGLDLTPSGFNVGGLPADQSGLFLGANGGGSPLDFAIPVDVNEILFFGLDSAGTPVFVLNVTGTIGAAPGTTSLSTGIVLNPVSVDLGVVELGFQFDVTTVPAPASAALLGLGGLVATRRRR